MAAQVLLLATQIRGEGGTTLIREAAVRVITPFHRAGTWVIDSVTGGWDNYLNLRDARQENAALRREVSDLRLRVQKLEGRAAEADRLAQLLAFRDAHPEADLLAARVIAASPSSTSKQVYLDRGARDGVRKDMGVITPDGVVGKILEVYPGTSLVLLITDRESGVGARLVSSRVNGVVRGTGEPAVLLDHVENDQEVGAGESILTSGLDRIFPKDLPVGTVIGTGPGSPFKNIRVQPAARLDRLEELFILLTREEWPAKEAEAAKNEAKKANP